MGFSHMSRVYRKHLEKGTTSSEWQFLMGKNVLMPEVGDWFEKIEAQM